MTLYYLTALNGNQIALDGVTAWQVDVPHSHAVVLRLSTDREAHQISLLAADVQRMFPDRPVLIVGPQVEFLRLEEVPDAGS